MTAIATQESIVRSKNAPSNLKSIHGGGAASEVDIRDRDFPRRYVYFLIDG